MAKKLIYPNNMFAEDKFCNVLVKTTLKTRGKLYPNNNVKMRHNIAKTHWQCQNIWRTIQYNYFETRLFEFYKKKIAENGPFYIIYRVSIFLLLVSFDNNNA